MAQMERRKFCPGSADGYECRREKDHEALFSARLSETNLSRIEAVESFET